MNPDAVVYHANCASNYLGQAQFHLNRAINESGEDVQKVIAANEGAMRDAFQYLHDAAIYLALKASTSEAKE